MQDICSRLSLCQFELGPGITSSQFHPANLLNTTTGGLSLQQAETANEQDEAQAESLDKELLRVNMMEAERLGQQLEQLLPSSSSSSSGSCDSAQQLLARCESEEQLDEVAVTAGEDSCMSNPTFAVSLSR